MGFISVGGYSAFRGLRQNTFRVQGETAAADFTALLHANIADESFSVEWVESLESQSTGIRLLLRALCGEPSYATPQPSHTYKTRSLPRFQLFELDGMTVVYTGDGTLPPFRAIDN